jgi:hypothetical protein
MSVTMHTWRRALPEITQSLSYSKSLTSDSQFSQTDKSFPYWDKEENRVTPQMYLDANKDDNGGKKNTGATCCHARTYAPNHTLSPYWSLTTSTSLTITL